MTNQIPVNKKKTFTPITMQKYETVIPTAFDPSLSMLEKVNKVIKQMNELGLITNDLIEQWNKLLEWIIGEGIENAVNERLNSMIADGTLADIINVQIFEDLNFKIDSKLDRVIFNQILPELQEIDKLPFISTSNDPDFVTNGTVDMTQKLQDYIDELQDGQTLYIAKGIYKVSKNLLLEGFPNNDQPCLLIRGKKNINIVGYGVTFVSDVHAQGIMEVQQCSNINIEGITFKGHGLFPSLDPLTGYGEKGTQTGGYDTSGFWGYRKNNSFDTSTRHNPSTNQAYGKFGNGFIGNVGIGLLIHNDNKHITVRNCEAHGFNYSGFQVGHLGDYLPTNINAAINKFIVFEDCYSHDNYSQNFYSMDVDQIHYERCVSERAGHPNANRTHKYVDPGYGFGMGGSDYAVSKNVTIMNCKSLYDKRKGIDAHRGEGFICQNNYIEGAMINGIFYKTTNATQRSLDFDISNNKLVKVGSGLNMGATIEVGGVRGADYSEENAIVRGKINNNVLIKCFGVYGIIETGTVKNIEIIGNQIDEILASADRGNQTAKPYGIYVGYALQEEPSYIAVIKDNIINGSGYVDLVGGIIARNLVDGLVEGNFIKLKHSAVESGIKMMDCTLGKTSGNLINLGASGVPIMQLRNTFLITGNVSSGGATPVEAPSMTGKRISFKLSVSNGVKTILWFEGQEFVTSIANDIRGMKINLKGTQKGVYPMVSYMNGGRTILSTLDKTVKYVHLHGVGESSVTIGLMSGSDTVGIQGTDIDYDSLQSGSAIFTIMI